MNARNTEPGSLLLQPVALLALAVLLLNDHWLKAASPGFITGKLSDFAGLVVFPCLLASVCEWLGVLCGEHWRLQRRHVALLALVTGSVFACIKTSAYCSGVYVEALVQLWTPLRGWLNPEHIKNYVDVSDLLALPALLVPVALARRVPQSAATPLSVKG